MSSRALIGADVSPPAQDASQYAEASASVPAHSRSLEAVLSVGLLGVVLSLVWLLGHAASLEESANLLLAQRPLEAVVSGAAQSAQMPFYYLLLHGVQAEFGRGLTPARLLSLGCYLLMLPLAYWAGRRTAAGDAGSGRLAAALIGLSPFVVWFSDKVTVYALLALLALLSHYLFIRLLDAGARWRWRDYWLPLAYVVVGLLGLATHYIFVLLLSGQMVFGIVKRREMARHTRYILLVSGMIMAGALIAWLYYAAAFGPFWHNFPLVSRPSATQVFITYVQFLFGFQSVTVTTLVLAFWPLLVVVALLAVQKYLRPPAAVQYLGFAAFVPVAAAFALSWTWLPVFLSFYLIICLPPFMLLLSWFVTTYNLRIMTLARRALVAGMVAMLFAELFITRTPIQAGYHLLR